MRIVVTGSEGHIGRAVCDAAAAMGHELVRVDVSGSANRPPIDIRDRAALMTAFEGAEAVIHAAALHAPHMGSLEDAAFRSVNVEGTSCVLSAIATVGIRRMVFTSTTAVFGPGPGGSLPARWTTEETPVAPRTIYHATKLAAEDLVRRAAATGAVAASILRLGRCFPEPLDVMAIHRLCRGIDPRDAAAAHLRALEYADFNAAPLIVSAQTPFSPSDCRALGISAEEVIEERCPGVVEAFRTRGWSVPKRIDRVYDSSQAQSTWDWRPQHDVWSILGGAITVS